MSSVVKTYTAAKYAGFALAFAGVCSAHDGLSVRSKKNQKWPAAEDQRIYSSAGSVPQQEFGRTIPLAPKATLVLGADKNEVWFVGGEVTLTEWNRDAFAQGVVGLTLFDCSTYAFSARVGIAKRAVNWADSTLESNN